MSHHNIEIQHLDTKPRNSGIAFIFSLLFLGLGQIYNGQPIKGLILLSSIWLTPLIFSVSGALNNYSGFVILLVLMVITYVYGILDAVWNAKRRKDYIAKYYNTWYAYVILAIVISTAFVFVKPTDCLSIKSFDIPTTSNYPTFHVGDLIVADMNAYENTNPKYGDIVVFTKPDGQLYIFRIVGLPGDTIVMTNNEVMINGQPNALEIINNTTFEGVPVLELEETLPNGHKHNVLHYIPSENDKSTHHLTRILPADSFFVLGDNRDNAYDSRYDGLVGRHQINGRVRYNYWNTFEKDRRYIDFTSK